MVKRIEGVEGRRRVAEAHNRVTRRVPFSAGRRDAFRVERRQHRDALSHPRADGMAERPIGGAVSFRRLQHGSGVRSARQARLQSLRLALLAIHSLLALRHAGPTRLFTSSTVSFSSRARGGGTCNRIL